MRAKIITAWALSAVMLFGACGAVEEKNNNLDNIAVTPMASANMDVADNEKKQEEVSNSFDSADSIDNYSSKEEMTTVEPQPNDVVQKQDEIQEQVSVQTATPVPTQAVSVETHNEDKSDIIVIKLTGDSAVVTGDDDGVVKVKDGKITVKGAGTYELTGSYNGNIEINGKDGEINLVLNGVNLTSSNLAPLYIKKTTSTNIYLADGSVNILTDASEYSYEVDEEGKVEEDPSACLHVKGNLTFDGTGTLVVNANYNDGIKSSQDLVINSGNISVNSVGDGISSSKSSVTVNGGIFNIVCNGGAVNGSDHHDSFDMGGRGWGAWGNQNTTTTTTSSDDDISSKAIKAEAEVVINGGQFTIDASDDAVHSNTTVTINGGDFSIDTGDDAIHADEALVINQCKMLINQSYEGLEALYVKITGGDIVLKSTDDGINASGGNSGGMGFQGFGGATGSTTSLVIDGGKLQIYAGGDGVDSNGTMEFNGGEVYVDGPTDSGNTAVDSDNSFVVNGGTLLAVGSTGMLEYPSNTSNQPVIIWRPGNMAAGTTITIKDSTGKEILNYTPTKTYQGVIYSSAILKLNETYTITAGSLTSTFVLQYNISGIDSNGTVTDCTTSSGFGGFGGFGGNRGDRNQGNFGNGQNPGGFGGNQDQNNWGDRGQGNKGDRNNGAFPGNGEMPQMPNGQVPNGEMPQMPNGQAPNGEMPPMPGESNS